MTTNADRGAGGGARRFRNREFWDKRASSFAGYAGLTRYAEEFLRLTTVDPEWTAFDMGCGAGTLALPLAAKVKKVTAVDFSNNMLAILRRRCEEEGVRNVTTILGGWEDDWGALGIGEHDIAIVARRERRSVHTKAESCGEAAGVPVRACRSRTCGRAIMRTCRKAASHCG